MQLIRDNLTLWTSEIDDDNEKIFEVSNFHHLKFVFEHVQHIYGLSVFFN